MDQHLTEIPLSDPRISDEARACPQVAAAMAKGFKYFWDAMDCRVRFIKPSDGTWHRVTVPTRQRPKGKTQNFRQN